MADFDHEGSGGLTLSGQSQILGFVKNFTALGGVTLSGQLQTIGFETSFAASGGVKISNRYSCKRGVVTSYDYDLESSYTILPSDSGSGSGSGFDDIVIDFSSSYEVGIPEKYWWRIQCCCKPAIEGEGLPPEGGGEVLPFMPSGGLGILKNLATNPTAGPDTIQKYNGMSKRYIKENKTTQGISAQFHDDVDHSEEMCQAIYNSGGKIVCGNGDLTLLSLVRCPTVNDVCAIIQDPGFGPEFLDVFGVLNIQKWEPDLRLWVDQEYCNYPNCIPLCTDFAPDDHAAFTMRVIENYHEIESSGGPSVSGSAISNMFIVDHTAEGIISFSGSIDSLISPSHTYVSEGSVSMGGSSPIVVQNLFREASGGVSITDSYSEVISPSHQYTANSYSSSQVEVSGSGFSFVDYFNESIYRAIFNSDSCFNRIFIAGSAEASTYKIFEYVSQGSVSIAGSAEILSNYYEYEFEGTVTVSGKASVVTPSRNYESEGGIVLSGGFDNLLYSIVGSGGIVICRDYDFPVISGPISTYNIAGFESRSRGLTFNNDGTKMFVVGETGDDVNEFALSVGFDLSSSVTFTGAFSVSANCPNPTAVKFNPDGTKMFLTTFGNSNVHEYDLTTGFDVSTASFSQTLITNTKDSNNFGLDFSDDGTKMFITGNQNDKIYEWSLSSAFDISTATFVQDLYLGTQDFEPFGIEFIDDGYKMYVIGTLDNGVDWYSLSSPYDISTASHVGFFHVGGNPSGLHINPSTNRMYICGTMHDLVKEFDMNSGCDAESYYAFTHTGSGGIVLGGGVEGISAPSFEFTSPGLGPVTVTNDGVYVSYRNLGEFEDVFTAVMDVSNVTLNLDNANINDGFSDLSINTGTVNACGCQNVGVTVALLNNLPANSEIGSFLDRNNLSLDSLALRYSNPVNSWNNVQHLSGLGADNEMQNWKFVFQLSCTSVFENIDTGDFYFKFLFLAQKEIPSKNIKLKTMFIVNMDTSLACEEDALLNLNIEFDSFEKIPLVDGNVIESFVYKDDIGIFSDSNWNNQHNYSFIRDGLLDGPVVTGQFPTFKLNIAVGKPFEYFYTAPPESIPQQQLLGSQVQNPTSRTDIRLLGQIQPGVTTTPRTLTSNQTSTSTIFP